MASQWLMLAAVVAVSSAALTKPLFHPAHSYQPSTTPHYNYRYKVTDRHTGDIKDQHERRVGDKVEGYYSQVEPDGSKRIVKYSADSHSGFNAVVLREPPPAARVAPTPAPTRVPVIPAPHHYAPPPKHGPVQFPDAAPTPAPIRVAIPMHYQRVFSAAHPTLSDYLIYTAYH